jgi:hypothetical protein
MDPVTQPVTGPEMEIHYNVCGLSSGTVYRGRMQLTQQRPVKKGATKPKPVVVTFRDRVDGPAARRHRSVALGKLKAGMYNLELSVTDNKGRERSRLEKIQVKAR